MAKTVTKKKAVVRKKAVDTQIVSEVFGSETLDRNQIHLFINGEDQGLVDTTNRKLGEFALERASQRGIRTFSLYVDGAKVNTSMSGDGLSGYQKMELVAKDARG